MRSGHKPLLSAIAELRVMQREAVLAATPDRSGAGQGVRGGQTVASDGGRSQRDPLGGVG